jgi:hypothetical protein
VILVNFPKPQSAIYRRQFSIPPGEGEIGEALGRERLTHGVSPNPNEKPNLTTTRPSAQGAWGAGGGHGIEEKAEVQRRCKHKRGGTNRQLRSGVFRAVLGRFLYFRPPISGPACGRTKKRRSNRKSIGWDFSKTCVLFKTTLGKTGLQQICEFCQFSKPQSAI